MIAAQALRKSCARAARSLFDRFLIAFWSLFDRFLIAFWSPYIRLLIASRSLCNRFMVNHHYHSEKNARGRWYDLKEA
jgi:hypothetical protein